MPHRTSTLLFAFAVSYAAPADDFGLLTRTSRLVVEEKPAVERCATLKEKITEAEADAIVRGEALKVPIPCINAASSSNEPLCGRCLSCHGQCAGAHDITECLTTCLQAKALDMSEEDPALPAPPPPPVVVDKTVVPILNKPAVPRSCPALKEHITKALTDAAIDGSKPKVPVPCIKAEAQNNEEACGTCLQCHKKCHAHTGAHDEVCIAECLLGKVVEEPVAEPQCQVLKKHLGAKALAGVTDGSTKGPCILAASNGNEQVCGVCVHCHDQCAEHAGKIGQHQKCLAECLLGKVVETPVAEAPEPQCEVLKEHLGAKALASVTDGSAKGPCILAATNGNEQVCGVCVRCHELCSENAPKGAQHQKCLVACVTKGRDKSQQKQLALLQRSSLVASCKKLGEEHRSLAKLSNTKDDVRLFKGASTEVKQQLRSLAETCFGELNGLGKDTMLKRSKKKIPACFLRNKGDKVGFVNCLGF